MGALFLIAATAAWTWLLVCLWPAEAAGADAGGLESDIW